MNDKPEQTALSQAKIDHNKELAAGMKTLALAAAIIILLPPLIAFITYCMMSK